MKPSDNPVIDLTAKFQSRIFRTDDNSYCVGVYANDEGTFRVVGTDLPEVSFPVIFRGKWRVDPRFGKQFQVDMIVAQLPAVKADIVQYIASLRVGIGAKRAEKMLDMVAPGQFFTELEQDPMQFTSIKGISAKTISLLQDKVAQMATQASLFKLFGSDLSMNSRQFRKIHAMFHGDTKLMISKIESNPFVLMPCGYKFVDLDAYCAKRNCFYVDDYRRLLAAAQQALLAAKSSCHVGLPGEVLIADMRKLLRVQGDVEAYIIAEFLDDAAHKGSLKTESGLIYLPNSYEEEALIAHGLSKMMEKKPETLNRSAFEKRMKEFEAEKGFSLSKDQTEAVWTALLHSVCVITGGPGTGKSTILDAILFCWNEFFDSKWRLMAPTGRASVRMTETTGQAASTIHSALQLRVETEDLNAALESYNQIYDSLAVVDEVSMVDQSAMAALIEALQGWKEGFRQHLVLVGDRNQLPSVGWGNVLADIIDSGAIPVCTLSSIYRQGTESPIVANSKKILDGETSLVWDNAFRRFHVGGDDANMDAACTLYQRCVSAYGIEKVVLLSPYRCKTEICTDNLNQRLQSVLNPDHGQGQISGKGRLLRMGDRVMQNKNTETLSNGDIGTIVAIYPNAEDTDPCVVVQFENGTKEGYIRDRLEQLDLAYAMSIHKSQGGEFDTVLIVLPNYASSFLRRNLLYTAITRSKKNVAIISPTETIAACIRNDKKDERYTRLCARLQASVAPLQVPPCEQPTLSASAS